MHAFTLGCIRQLTHLYQLSACATQDLDKCKRCMGIDTFTQVSEKGRPESH